LVAVVFVVDVGRVTEISRGCEDEHIFSGAIVDGACCREAFCAFRGVEGCSARFL